MPDGSLHRYHWGSALRWKVMFVGNICFVRYNVLPCLSSCMEGQQGKVQTGPWAIRKRYQSIFMSVHESNESKK